jgi:molybdopterin synthase sulfur carrier subunit
MTAAGSPVITVRLRFFASLREALGPGDSMRVPQGASVAQVRRLLQARDEAHARALADGRPLRCAVDQVLCADEARVLHDGAELAFFPPVTGG